MLEKILNLSKEQKESILYDVKHTRVELIGLANKYNLNKRLVINRFNYLFNDFTKESIKELETYKAVIESLYSAKKLMIKYIERNK